MATKAYFKKGELGTSMPGFSKARAVIAAAFYGSNIVKINTLEEAYELVKNSPTSVVTEMPISQWEPGDTKTDTKEPLFNTRYVSSYSSATRKIEEQLDIEKNEYNKKIMDAIYDTRWVTMYHATVLIGLDPEFMLKAHLLIPTGHEHILYTWMSTFQFMSEEYSKIYKHSRQLTNETDIYIFSNPNWTPADHSLGFTYFNVANNYISILGKRDIREYISSTISIAWAIANRNGYLPFHGGLKRYNRGDGRAFVAGLLGLSNSEVSTIIQSKHSSQYNDTILYLDAFIINAESASSLTLVSQNVPLVTTAATTPSSWCQTLVPKIPEPLNAIFWILQDSSLPPVIKLTNPSLAAVAGALLVTKRSCIERLAPDIEPSALVVEPYANPYRIYPLVNDYMKYKSLFAEKNVNCYLINTGDFMGKKIETMDILHLIEAIVDEKACFKPLKPLQDVESLDREGYTLDLNNTQYKSAFMAKMKDRIAFIKSREVYKEGYDKLPDDALEALEKIISELS